MPNIGPMELIIVLAVALVVLGPKRLPEAGKSVGRGLREFKEGLAGKEDAGSSRTAALPDASSADTPTQPRI